MRGGLLVKGVCFVRDCFLGHCGHGILIEVFNKFAKPLRNEVAVERVMKLG